LIELGGLRVLHAGLRLSFQRFQRPADGTMAGAPSSLGALPVGADDGGRLLLPVAEDEAFWIGLGVADPATRLDLALAVVLADGRELDAISGAPWDEDRPRTVSVPETRRIDGVHCPDGRVAAFARSPASVECPACVELGFHATIATVGPGRERVPHRHHASASIELVDYEAFHTRTGLDPPSPLDPEAGYKGWRLP
jgi:hypothetical protein